MKTGRIRQYKNDSFKAKVALEAIKEEKTVNELSQEYAVSSGQVYEWKDRLQKNAASIFADKRKKCDQQDEIERLHRIIGKLTLENDFLEEVLNRSK